MKLLVVGFHLLLVDSKVLLLPHIQYRRRRFFHFFFIMFIIRSPLILVCRWLLVLIELTDVVASGVSVNRCILR